MLLQHLPMMYHGYCRLGTLNISCRVLLVITTYALSKLSSLWKLLLRMKLTGRAVCTKYKHTLLQPSSFTQVSLCIAQCNHVDTEAHTAAMFLPPPHVFPPPSTLPFLHRTSKLNAAASGQAANSKPPLATRSGNGSGSGGMRKTGSYEKLSELAGSMQVGYLFSPLFFSLSFSLFSLLSSLSSLSSLSFL